MDFESRPTKPVIKSSVSADAEWDYWLQENHFDHLVDQDGIPWTFEISFDQAPNPHDKHGGIWTADIQLGVDLPMSKLVETGTFDQVADERIINLAGSALIPLRMKKMQYECRNAADLRGTLIRVLPELRETFRKTSLHDIKRRLVGRWIDQRSIFGVREKDDPS